MATPHISAEKGDMRAIKKWLDTEGDVDRRDGYDNTVLHVAAKHAQAEVLKVVLEAGCPANYVNCAGDSPLHNAAATPNNMEVIKTLVDAGGDLGIANDHGNTALHYACFWRREDVCKYMISEGAMVSITNKYGKTPLQRAGERLSSTLRELALEQGQSLQSVQAEVRDLDRVAGEAKAKFIAKAGIKWHVQNSTISYKDPLTEASPVHAIFLGEWSGYKVAIKKPIEQEFTTGQLTMLEEDVTNLRKLFHPNILPIMGGCISMPNVCIFTELQTYSLFALLHDASFNMDQQQAIQFATEVCRGLHYLHDQDPFVCHMALKSSNILLTQDLQVKLTDYGLNQIFNSVINVPKLFEPQWSAPETLTSNDQTDVRPADVYSFGIILYEIVTRQIPFEGLNAMECGMKIVYENQQPEIPEFVPKHLAQLMKLCWQPEVSKRPKMAQILPILEKC